MYATKADAMRPIDRLESLINKEQLSPSAFEKEVKIANGYIAKQKAGKGGIGSEVLEKILIKYPSWDLYWIVSGKRVASTQPLNEPDVKYIPFYDVEAAAGNDVTMDLQPTTTHNTMIDVGDLLRDSECAIRIYGNSMTPNYPSGCVVGLREVRDNIIDFGNVYVIETEDNRYLKRLYQDDNGFMCYSDNNMKFTDGVREGKYYYEPFVIPKNTIRRIYRVTGVIKRNENSMIMGKN